MNTLYAWFDLLYFDNIMNDLRLHLHWDALRILEILLHYIKNKSTKLWRQNCFHFNRNYFNKKFQKYRINFGAKNWRLSHALNKRWTMLAQSLDLISLDPRNYLTFTVVLVVLRVSLLERNCFDFCVTARKLENLSQKRIKKVGKRGVRGWSLCFCFFWLYESSSWSCKKRVKSTAQQQSTEQRSCSPLRDEIRKKNRITKRHLRHFLPLFSPLNLPTKNSGICLGY